MNYRHKASHCLVVGKSGMGKTSFALRYINASTHVRVFVFDPEEEFAERLQIGSEGVAPSLAEIYTVAETQRIVIYDPVKEFPGAADEAFVHFSHHVYGIARDGLCPKGIQSLMVTDELQKYVNAHFAPPEFKTVLETGRRQMLDTLSLSRAPNRINSGVREEFTELVMFRLDDANSLKFAADVGADVDKVRTLPEHEYLYFNVVKGVERTGKIAFKT